MRNRSDSKFGSGVVQRTKEIDERGKQNHESKSEDQKNVRPEMSQKGDFLHFGQKSISEIIHSDKKIQGVNFLVRIVESFHISYRVLRWSTDPQKKDSTGLTKTFAP